MEKQREIFHKDLIAPCGMNCALCSGYLALRFDVKTKGIQMPYCEGCRPRNKKCAFLKKRCELLLNNKIQFCYECKEYPCNNLKHIDERYQTYFRTSFLENLACIKKDGVKKFLEMQKEKWQCPTCDDVLCCHNGLCYHCDTDTLKKKKVFYRWEDD